MSEIDDLRRKISILVKCLEVVRDAEMDKRLDGLENTMPDYILENITGAIIMASTEASCQK